MQLPKIVLHLFMVLQQGKALKQIFMQTLNNTANIVCPTGKFIGTLPAHSAILAPIVHQIAQKMGLLPNQYQVSPTANGLSLKGTNNKVFLTFGHNANVSFVNGSLGVLGQLHINTPQKAQIAPNVMPFLFVPKHSFVTKGPQTLPNGTIINSFMHFTVKNIVAYLQQVAPNLLLPVNQLPIVTLQLPQNAGQTNGFGAKLTQAQKKANKKLAKV